MLAIHMPMPYGWQAYDTDTYAPVKRNERKFFFRQIVFHSFVSTFFFFPFIRKQSLGERNGVEPRHSYIFQYLNAYAISRPSIHGLKCGKFTVLVHEAENSNVENVCVRLIFGFFYLFIFHQSQIDYDVWLNSSHPFSEHGANGMCHLKISKK